MITIRTNVSKVKNGDGSLATGSITITPNVEFEFTESGATHKVTMEPVQKTISSGEVADFEIAPTLNASQDKSNLYYIARFQTQSGSWTEYWTIDAGGASTLQLTDVAKTTHDPSLVTQPTVTSDEVSATAAASKIVRAGVDGKIAAGYIPTIAGTYVQFYMQASAPSPSASVVALWYDTTNNQFNVWTGTEWRTFA